MRKYSPRRQSKRWLDDDCPKGVLAIYDNRGATCDRYTVIYARPIAGDTLGTVWLGLRHMSDAPNHYQGVGIYSEHKAHDVSAFRYVERHNATKWSTLPSAVKRCVMADLSGEAAP